MNTWNLETWKTDSLTKNRVKLTGHIHRGVMREKETHSQWSVSGILCCHW